MYMKMEIGRERRSPLCDVCTFVVEQASHALTPARPSARPPARPPARMHAPHYARTHACIHVHQQFYTAWLEMINKQQQKATHEDGSRCLCVVMPMNSCIGMCEDMWVDMRFDVWLDGSTRAAEGQACM